MPRSRAYKRGKRLGKYRIVSLLGTGGFARVYRAVDEVEGRDVALKVPFEHETELDELLREVRIHVRLEHPHILPIRNATLVDGKLVIAYPLGERSLSARLRHRIASTKVLEIFEQVVDATAYAHGRRVIHCDINPHNVILFPDGSAKLSDFGIAKISARTRVLDASGSGTVGFVAPEQAMGQPSFRSDVFSLGLLLHRMLTATLPRWPYDWPPEGYDRLRRKATPPLIELLQRTTAVDEKRRPRNAIALQRSLRKIRSKLR